MSFGLEKVLLEDESFQAICVWRESGIVHLKTASGHMRFAELLEILWKPSHVRHDDLVEWVGGFWS